MREAKGRTAGGSSVVGTGAAAERRRALLRPPSALEALGLSGSEVALFEHLARAGPASLAALQEASEVSRVTRAAVTRLVELGLARRLPGRPTRYAAADPRSVLSSQLAEASPVRGTPASSGVPLGRSGVRAADEAGPLGERATDLAGPLSDDLAAGLAELALLARGAQNASDDVSGPLVERVNTAFEARARLAHVQAAAQSRVRTLTAGDVTEVASVAAAHGPLLARGVRCQLVYTRSALRDDAAMRAVEALASAGQECRVLPTLPLDLSLVDDSWALLPLAQPDPDGAPGSKPVAGLIVVHPCTLLDALSLLFDNLWRRALPVHAARDSAVGAVRGGSAAQGQQILAMMVSGATDEAIARRLGLSNRTLQRRIAELMDGMGVRTRFQLGIQAALRARSVDGAASETAPPYGPSSASGTTATPSGRR